MDKVNVGLIQMKHSADLKENFDKTIYKIEQLSKEGANIISTSELFKSLYFCQTEDWNNFKLAEVIDENNQTVKVLSKLAKDRNVVLVVSLFEKLTDGLYFNTAIVIDADGTLLDKYRKMHIPDDPHFYEKFYFTPGDLGYKTFRTKYGDIGVLICWDQWYPEAARLTALSGAQVIFYPTAIGWLPSEKEQFGKQQYLAWETIQRSHSIANGCYIASINRVGFEPSPNGNEGIEFWGQSFISDPYGEILYRASDREEENILWEVDLSIIDSIRTTWPFFRDRRIDSYGDLTKRWIG
ncbi:MAG: carbon-nitrogen hydrolase [Hydrogenothermaceae bacterium]|nr:carbon-nitrogen hydrolase [Hydrogenothermaceae bacterium]